jgi:hypothetical protein
MAPQLLFVVCVCGVASALSSGDSFSSVGRHPVRCASRDYVLSVRVDTTSGATLGIVRIRRVRGPACRLSRVIRVTVVDSNGETIGGVDGNPASFPVRARLARRAIERHVLWNNWCGPARGFAFDVGLGSVRANTAATPPRCFDGATRSRLAPLASFGQPQPLLGPAPTACGPPPPRSRPNAHYAPMVGEAPFWFAPGIGADSALHITADVPHTDLGWRVKTLWVVAKQLRAPVTVRLGGLAGERMRVQFGGVRTYTSFHLDPEDPRAFHDPEMADFPSYAYYPKAGCYFVDAAWPGGATRVFVGVGR